MHPVVVIAPGHGELREVLVHPLSDGQLLPQVHGGALHRSELPGGDGAGDRGGVARGRQLDVLSRHRAALVARQIEVGVIGQVAQGVPVALGPVADGQPGLRQGVGHLDRQVSGVALLAVGALEGQGEAVLRLLLHRPDLLVKAPGAAVEVVLPVVGRQRVLRPVQGEGGPADAVAVPADEGADVLVLLPVVLQGVKAQHHVHRISLPVRGRPGTGSPRRR